MFEAYSCEPIDLSPNAEGKSTFQGKNTLCFGGRLVMGPDLKATAPPLVVSPSKKARLKKLWRCCLL